MQTYCINDQVLKTKIIIDDVMYKWPGFYVCLQIYCLECHVLLYVCRRTVKMAMFCCMFADVNINGRVYLYA